MAPPDAVSPAARGRGPSPVSLFAFLPHFAASARHSGLGLPHLCDVLHAAPRRARLRNGIVTRFGYRNGAAGEWRITMFLRSERLFLRPGWPEDWEELCGQIADEQVVRNLASAPWPYAGEDARSFLALPQSHRHPRFLITVPDAPGARIVGGIGLDKIEGGVELGYWVARDHWGQGYASEAARSVVALAETLGHRRVTAQHFIDNPASGRVLEKTGFRRTGRVVERFSKGRGKACPVRSYELALGPSRTCDDLLGCKRAA